MKKVLILVIIAVLLTGFLNLVFYGLRHARGIPVAATTLPEQSLDVPFYDRELDLTKGVSPEDWSSAPATEIQMYYQAMVLPWGQNLISPVTVKSFHNQKNIYFHLSWPDDTENRSLSSGQFSDACAIMFRLEKGAPPSTIMMGFMGKSNLWQWKASQDGEYWLKMTPAIADHVDFHYPAEEKELFPVSKPPFVSAVNDLLAIRVGTITPKENQDIQGRGVLEQGRWQVVFKRALKINDVVNAPVFDPAQDLRCVFAVWNGAKSDRGGRKSVSNWVKLNIKP